MVGLRPVRRADESRITGRAGRAGRAEASFPAGRSRAWPSVRQGRGAATHRAFCVAVTGDVRPLAYPAALKSRLAADAPSTVPSVAWAPWPARTFPLAGVLPLEGVDDRSPWA